MKKILLYGVFLISLMMIPPMASLSYIYYEVFHGDYSYLDKGRIIEILSKETHLYYADGQTQLGSLFGTEHRMYVPIHAVNDFAKKAVVAAEDESFYRHIGIDFPSLFRAVYRTFVLRRREGASTITQQTVKNLYGRSVTNVRTKFIEMINALKMERKFKKDEILEFYLNQFHVVGNGRGIGVAAKYYFNKDVEQLTLTEAAFIAGSVKGPDKYNPFTKRTLDSSKRARENAFTRKNYVLKRMLTTKFITPEQYDSAKNEAVPFRQGRFQFNELAVTELVQRQLGKKEILQAMGVDSPDAVGTMGLRITTTLEKEAQQGAQYGMRQNLSRLEMILSGFSKELPQSFQVIQQPEPMGFYVGRVVSKNQTPASLNVSLGLPECVVPPDGIERVAKILDQSQYRGLAQMRQILLDQISVGDFVLVSVRPNQPVEGQPLECDLERRPRIQGGLIALDKGHVVSMVGGYSPNEYNRAVFAKRQPGSTFKSLTFYPALQLGWSVLDPLLNVRSVYQWQGQLYFPRPDHPPETAETTLVGAGSKSENLASVWLMSQITQRLTFDQFKDLLRHLELFLPQETENQAVQRIAAKFNVKFTDEQFQRALLSQILDEMANDIQFGKNAIQKAILLSMKISSKFPAEILKIQNRTKALPLKERNIRVNLLKNELHRWERLVAPAIASLKSLGSLLLKQTPLTREERQTFSQFAYRPDIDGLCYISTDAFNPSHISSKFKDLSIHYLNLDSALSLITAKPNLLEEDQFLLDCAIPIGVVADIKKQIQSRAVALNSLTPLEKLYWHSDFRYSLGMYYAHTMVKHMGVSSQVEWVPSYPLGANVVTLAELAMAYQTFLEGKTYQFFQEGSENQLLIIKRIEDALGNLVWEPVSKSHQLVDKDFSSPILSILRATVTHGTGRAAHTNVLLKGGEGEDAKELQKLSLKIPTFGKTGTTNDYTNATYVGFLPYPAEDDSLRFSNENAITIASYVGYDTNEPMTRKRFRVAGGTGALPAWIEAAKAIIQQRKFSKKLNWKKIRDSGLKEVPFEYGSGLPKVTVGLHGSTVAGVSGVQNEENDDSQDLNAFINDYALSNKSQIQLNIPGRVRDNVFLPSTKIEYFSPRVFTPDPNEGGLLTELPERPGEIKEDSIREEDLSD